MKTRQAKQPQHLQLLSILMAIENPQRKKNDMGWNPQNEDLMDDRAKGYGLDETIQAIVVEHSRWESILAKALPQ